MRRKIIAGNWKMYKTRDDALDFIYAVNTKLPSINDVESVIFASPIYLRTLVKRQEENLKIGSQNMHYLDEGAYTGEVSNTMLTNIGVTYVLIGHSERRTYFNETDKDVNLKIKKALSVNLKPMVCVGEELKTRESNETNQFIKNQINLAFKDISAEDALKVVIAYEPIWAIGTGKTATPDQANETIKEIRKDLEEIYGKNYSDQIRILYGGSVKEANIKDILEQSDIDGALIGGASLDPNAFINMCNIAKDLK